MTTLPYQKVTIDGSAGEWMHLERKFDGIGKWEPDKPIGWVYGPLLGVTTMGASWRDEPSSGSTPIWEKQSPDAPIVAWAPSRIEIRVIGCKYSSVKVRYKGVEGWLKYGSYSGIVPLIRPPTKPARRWRSPPVTT